MKTIWIAYCLDCHFATLRRNRKDARYVVKYRKHKEHRMRVVSNLAFIKWKSE